MPNDYSSPLLPTRSVPSFASDPRYLEELKARKLREMQSRQPTPSTVSPSFHGRNAMSSAEGPMLDGMRASELIRQPAASTGRANPSAEGPLLDDMLAAELFKRAQEYESSVGRARANQGFQQGLGVPMDAFQTFKNVNRRPEARPFQQGLGVPMDAIRDIQERAYSRPQGLGAPIDAFQTWRDVNRRPEARPFQQGLGLPADDMRALLERQEMVRRMEAQGYTR